MKKAVVKQKTPKGSTSKTPATQRDATQQKESGDKESVTVVKKEGDLNKEKGLDSKAEAASTAQMSTSSQEKLTVAGSAIKEEVDETAATAKSVSSKSVPVENQSQTDHSESEPMPEKSETAVVVKETIDVDKEANNTVSEWTETMVLASEGEMASDAEKPTSNKLTATKENEEMTAKVVIEPVQLGETEAEATEPKESGSCADVQEESFTTPVALPENKPPTSTSPPTESKAVNKGMFDIGCVFLKSVTSCKLSWYTCALHGIP